MGVTEEKEANKLETIELSLSLSCWKETKTIQLKQSFNHKLQIAPSCPIYN